VKLASAFAREEVLFVAAVLVGSVTGLVAGRLLVPWVSDATAGNIALAVAYLVMRGIHTLLT